MHKHSELFIDIFMPSPEFLQNSKGKPQRRIEFFNSSAKKETIIKEILHYDDETEIVTVDWFYQFEEKTYNQFSFDMKIYYPDTMNRILIDSGFDILKLWGDYNRANFNEESTLQIYQCQIK